MIASLNGTLERKALDSVVVEVAGVGYHVLVSTQTLADLPPPNSEVKLLCHTHVREDALQLYGFSGGQERTVFELLITVSGVGPRLALTILSGMDVATLSRAIAEGDHGRLQAIPGVGKKTAERLVVDIRDKVGQVAVDVPGEQPEGVSSGQMGERDVVAALVNLGYKRTVAERAVDQVLRRHAEEGKPLPAEMALREALGAIAGM